MTERETKLIDELIKAYERIIKHYEKQILTLRSKKVSTCCFEGQIKIKIKGQIE